MEHVGTWISASPPPRIGLGPAGGRLRPVCRGACVFRALRSIRWSLVVSALAVVLGGCVDWPGFTESGRVQGVGGDGRLSLEVAARSELFTSLPAFARGQSAYPSIWVRLTALELLTRASECIVAQVNGRLRVSATLERAEALRDADFAILCVVIGGLAAVRYDLEIPEHYGVYQPVGDTVGPAGSIGACGASLSSHTS